MEIHCPYCLTNKKPSGSRTHAIVKHGVFFRRSDLSKQTRYLCRACNKSFSSATNTPCYYQKKRHLNPLLFELFASGLSQRRLSRVLRIDRKTVVRKFLFLSLWAHYLFEKDRDSQGKAFKVEFDDLETFEHSKLKPLSVTMAVESKTRRILGFRVARMPAKGMLVEKALKKYGPRKDERAQQRRKLFAELKSYIDPGAEIRSDQNPHYPKDVRDYFPESHYKTYPGRRGCVVGQGELKAGGYDPLYSLNHTYAMLRANINRLFRRTWNTTKKPERLALHIALYSLYHNRVLLQPM